MFKIYEGETVVVEGESPLAITGLDPDTNVTEGTYQVVRLDGDKESDRVDIPAFKTLPIVVTGVTLSPKTSTGETGEAGERQLTTTVEPSNATNKAITYSIEPSATGLAVSESGKITWSAETPAGIYTTTVKSTDGDKTDTHVLTLTDPEPEPEPEPDPEEPEE